jgi:glycerol uptake facilitator protein
LVGEFIGTMVLIILGDGVVAGVLLARSKAQNSGWIVITAGWGFAVAVAVYAVGGVSGAHINPAVTIGLASIGRFPWSEVPGYIIAQVLGAFVGAVIVYASYFRHWAPTEDAVLKLAVFSTGPAIRDYAWNFLTEVVGTAMLLYGVLAIASGQAPAASGLTPLLIGILVFAIGLSLGGPTGYAINPARDAGPRVAHTILPIPGKRDSDWRYGWVPIVAPIVGGVLGALLYQLTFVNLMGVAA